METPACTESVRVRDIHTTEETLVPFAIGRMHLVASRARPHVATPPLAAMNNIAWLGS